MLSFRSRGSTATTGRGCFHSARLELVPGRVRSGGARGRRRAALPGGAHGARRAPARLPRRARVQLAVRARLPAHRHAAGAARAAQAARQVSTSMILKRLTV